MAWILGFSKINMRMTEIIPETKNCTHDNKNMYRKADRTRESEQFALAESRLAARTQQIKSDNAEPDAYPHRKTDALFEENEADYRHQ